MRVKLIIEYNGAMYAGWQRQENALAIQQVIEESIFALTGERINIVGAGRTDSGVHALGQTAHFDTFSTIPADRFAPALNTILPESIRIRESSEADENFSARYSAKGKTYQYKIYNSRVNSPLHMLDHAYIPLLLDVDRMKAAAKYFLGEHDFAAFCARDKRNGSTIRSLWQCDIVRIDKEIIITVSGKSFLYNMVRIISGTLIEVGLGKIDPDSIPELITKKERTLTGQTAPANGLTLKEVYY